ncbi:MAG: ribonuclease P protein component [Kiloniellaceae bacterium]
MMPTVRRLKTRPQFLKVAAARRKWAAPGLVLQAAKRQHGEDRAAPVARMAPEKTADTAADTGTGDAGIKEEEAEVRVGFTVTRKVGNAVVRNRVKRRLRAAAGEVFPRVGRAGTDYVVIGRAGTLTRPYDALCADLEQAIVKLDTSGRRGAPKPGTSKPGTPRETSQ